MRLGLRDLDLKGTDPCFSGVLDLERARGAFDLDLDDLWGAGDRRRFASNTLASVGSRLFSLLPSFDSSFAAAASWRSLRSRSFFARKSSHASVLRSVAAFLQP